MFSTVTPRSAPPGEAGEVSVKLLVVEDDTTITTAVERGLEAEGDRVEASADGSDGRNHSGQRRAGPIRSAGSRLVAS